jgi:hypothetical protein
MTEFHTVSSHKRNKILRIYVRRYRNVQSMLLASVGLAFDREMEMKLWCKFVYFVYLPKQSNDADTTSNYNR